MVRRIKPVSHAGKAEKEVRKSRQAGPGGRPALPDPVALVQPAVDVMKVDDVFTQEAVQIIKIHTERIGV